MFSYNQYVRAESLDQAYELYQKKNNIILGGMLWLKMQTRNCAVAVDLCDLGLDQITEDEKEFRIGAYVSLRSLEKHEGLNAYTHGAMEEAMKHIVGVQFRNTATLGGSIWGRFGYSDVLSIFMALDAKVHLHHAGVLTMEEFMALSRRTRDILVEVIVPKTTEKVAYLSQRNTQTDFPVLTCAVAKGEKGYKAVIGARPSAATPVEDAEGILMAAEESCGCISEEAAKAFGDYVAEQVMFGSNSRAGAAYRKKICAVLVKRAALAACNQGCCADGKN